MNNMEELIVGLKEQIIDALNLEEITPEDIDNEAPLFGEGLGLDSIDALELIVILDKFYGIKLANPAEGKAIFKNINTIADYIVKNRTKYWPPESPLQVWALSAPSATTCHQCSTPSGTGAPAYVR